MDESYNTVSTSLGTVSTDIYDYVNGILSNPSIIIIIVIVLVVYVTIFFSLGVIMFFPAFISKDILAYLLIPSFKVTLIYTLKRKKATLNPFNLNNKTIARFGNFSYNRFLDSATPS